jgi:hypothetical protein
MTAIEAKVAIADLKRQRVLESTSVYVYRKIAKSLGYPDQARPSINTLVRQLESLITKTNEDE